MRRRRSPEVLVVGAGPIGTSVACHLLERGVEVEVIDERRGLHTPSSSVLLYADTLSRLLHLGVPPDALEPSARIASVVLAERGEPRATIHLGDSDRRLPRVVWYPALEAELASRLDEKRVGVGWKRRVVSVRPREHEVEVKVGHIERDIGGYAVMELEEVVGKIDDERARWVVGADGPDSLVRAAIEPGADPILDEALYAALELRSPGPREDALTVVIDDDVTATSWPLPGGGHRWNFRLPHEGGYRDRLRNVKPEPTVRDLMHLLVERLPWLRMDPDDLAWADVQRLRPTMAREVGRGRIWLAGDAAHRLDPLAGRAINEGLAEAERLAERIAAALEGGGGVEGLRSYERDARARLEPVAEPERCYDAGGLGDGWLARNYARIVPLLPAEGDDLERLTAQLGMTRRRAA